MFVVIFWFVFVFVVVSQEILIGESLNVGVSIDIAIAEHLHFVDVFDGHTALILMFGNLTLIFLIFHPLKMIIEEVFGRTWHFSDREKAIWYVSHGFVFPLIDHREILEGVGVLLW
jgi:hypothetical protein